MTYAGIVSATYDSYTDGRNHFKNLLDAADRGHLAGVRRERRFTAVVDGDRLRRTLAQLRPSNAQVVSEDGAWSVFLPGLPIAAEAVAFDDAVDEVVQALREYVDDWDDHLGTAPNHAVNWPVVQLVGLSDDTQLREWLVGGPWSLPAPTRDHHQQLCSAEQWQLVTRSVGTLMKHHVTYELSLPDGRTLRTRISRPVDRTTYGSSIWAHILRDQLDVGASEFWACVQRGVLPGRGSAELPTNTVSADLVHLLIHTVGVPEDDVRRMSRLQAIERINAHWASRP